MKWQSTETIRGFVTRIYLQHGTEVTPIRVHQVVTGVPFDFETGDSTVTAVQILYATPIGNQMQYCTCPCRPVESK